jgi:hypothetical protein
MPKKGEAPMPNATVPAAIPNRPFAICPPTNLMNLDGFFVINMGAQVIQAYVVNQSGAQLNNVRVYIEGISDPGVVLTPEVQTVGNVPGDASFPVRFRASFLTASPGVALVSFIVESDGLVFKRIIKKIFITRVEDVQCCNAAGDNARHVPQGHHGSQRQSLSGR